jgi:histone H3/H4
MSAQFKLDQNTAKGSSEAKSESKKEIRRPNIDNLLKRISDERHQERKSNLIILFFAVLAISIATFVFSQG